MTVLDILHAKNASQTSSVDGAEMMIIQQLADVYRGILQVSGYQVHILPHIHVGPLFCFFFRFDNKKDCSSLFHVREYKINYYK